MVSIHKACALALRVSSTITWGIIPTLWLTTGSSGFGDIGENQFVLPDVTVDAYVDSKQWCNNYDIQLEMSYVQQAS